MTSTYSGLDLWLEALPNKSGRPGFYAGRMPSSGDFSSDDLETIFQFIKSKIGEKEAKAFVRFVYKLKDLSATGFMQDFFRWVDSGFKVPRIARKGVELVGRDEMLRADAQGHVLGALFGGPLDPKKVERASFMIKDPFLRMHKNLLPENVDLNRDWRVNPFTNNLYAW